MLLYKKSCISSIQQFCSTVYALLSPYPHNIYLFSQVSNGSTRRIHQSGGWGRTGCKRTKYRWLFSKNTALPYNFFQNTNTELFYRIPSSGMYLQATRPKFLPDSIIDACFIKLRYITHYMISNMHFKGIKSVASIKKCKKRKRSNKWKMKI